jgi:two-component system NarL family response regulator
VLEGEAALPRALVARVIAEFRDQSAHRRLSFAGRPVIELTSREWQVLELLRDGSSTKEIAERLFISRVTVRTHISSILRKLRAPSREAAIRLLNGSER